MTCSPPRKAATALWAARMPIPAENAMADAKSWRLHPSPDALRSHQPTAHPPNRMSRTDTIDKIVKTGCFRESFSKRPPPGHHTWQAWQTRQECGELTASIVARWRETNSERPLRNRAESLQKAMSRQRQEGPTPHAQHESASRKAALTLPLLGAGTPHAGPTVRGRRLVDLRRGSRSTPMFLSFRCGMHHPHPPTSRSSAHTTPRVASQRASEPSRCCSQTTSRRAR
jgi:hypothetical protein